MAISLELLSSFFTLIFLVIASTLTFYLKDRHRLADIVLNMPDIVFVTADRAAEFTFTITNRSSYTHELHILVDDDTIPPGWIIHFSGIDFFLDPTQTVEVTGYIGVSEITSVREEQITLFLGSTDPDHRTPYTMIVRTSTEPLSELRSWRNGWKEFMTYLTQFHKNIEERVSENLPGSYRACKNFIDIFQEISTTHREIMLDAEREEALKKLRYCCSILETHTKKEAPEVSHHLEELNAMLPE